MTVAGRKTGTIESEIERHHIASILASVDRNANVSQRTLAKDLGIALGLVNLYLRRCAKKGLIKVRQIPPRRYGYYLTAQGFAEKSRLTAEYLSWSFTFFRRARGECSELLAEAAKRKWRRVGLAGHGDLADIAIMLAAEHGLRIVAVWDAAAIRPSISGVRTVANLEDTLADVDGWILTSIDRAQSTYDVLRKASGATNIIVPSILSVRTKDLPRDKGKVRI
jgi:DNA-binding MarR family transcriptional regulator